MRSGALVLVLGLAVGAGAHVAYFRAHQPPDQGSLDGQLSWMRSELGLTDAQFARIRELHEASSPRLRSLAAQVAQMQTEFTAFENTRRTSDRVDFVEFAQFVEARRQVNRECLESTRRLIQETADAMTPQQREHYFGIVAVAAPAPGPLTN
jgi:hypothetical protein